MLLFFLFLISKNPEAKGVTPRNYTQQLLDGYDKYLSPYYFTDQKPVLLVSVPWILLIELNEEAQIASWSLGITTTWHDPRLEFDPNDFDGHRTFYLPSDLIWTPRLSLYNSIETKCMTEGDEVNVQVTEDGNLQTTTVLFARTTCKIRTSRIPYDTQTCTIEVSDSVTNTSFFEIKPVVTDGVYTMDGGQFRITNISTFATTYLILNQSMNDAYFWVILERHTVYFTIVVIIPTILISVLTVTGILLPVAHHMGGDVIQVGMTSMLAHSITLTVVASTMAKSREIPIIGYFVIECLAVCSLAVVVGLFLGHFEKNASKSGHLPQFFYAITAIPTGVDEKTGKKTSPASCGRVLGRLYFVSFSILQFALFIILLIFFSYSWNRENLDDVDRAVDPDQWIQLNNLYNNI